MILSKTGAGLAYGILLKDISDSYIQHNTFFKETLIGLHLEGTSRMEIRQNLFKENGSAIKVQASCEDNSFHHNNFIGNSFDVGTNGTMVLNTFSSNYWDKYEGYDMNKKWGRKMRLITRCSILPNY